MRFSTLGKVIGLAAQAYRSYGPQILTLAILGLVAGILEGIGINAVIPLISFILEGAQPATDPISQSLRWLFGTFNIDFAPKFLLIFIVLLFFGKAFVMLILQYIQVRITADYEAKTRFKIFQASMRASWRYLIDQKSGYLETISMVDVPASTNFLRLLSSMIMQLTGLVIYLIVAVNISPWITATTVVLGLAIFFTFRPVMRWVRMLSTERADLNRKTTHHIGEYMGGMKVVKAFGVEKSAIERVTGLFEKVKELSVRIMLLQSASVIAVPPIGILYIAIIFALAFRTDLVTFAALPAIVYLIYRISLYIQQLQTSLQAVSEFTPHLSATLAFESAATTNEERASGSRPFSFEKELRFDTVGFSYDSKPTLEDVSFSIPKGSMTGIIGPSGSGKTTCVDLMLRLLVPSQGRITLDDVPVQDIDPVSWHKKVAYVSQDVFLIRGTIRDNIAFYHPALSDEDIMEAARMAHIDDFIIASANGFDTLVGDRGVTLSAGQRQRLSIARALARKPEILVLDEATSALDSESEKHIHEVVKELKGMITIVVIAHRLATITDSDQLIVLDKGRVAETGEPEKLLKDKDSYFFKVYSIR